MQREEITRAILRYMLDHPQACDSMEGIIQWWITCGIVEIKVEEATDTIEGLVNHGLLVEKEQEGVPNKLYSINKEKLFEIRKLLDE